MMKKKEKRKKMENQPSMKFIRKAIFINNKNVFKSF